MIIMTNIHDVKSAQIWIFFWSVFSRIRAEYGDLLRRYIFHTAIITATTTTTITMVITISAISLFILGKKIYLQY